MVFHVLTLFPEMIRQACDVSILKRAGEQGLVVVDPVNIRDYSSDKHHSVDDYPYGGGAGMVMQAQPVYDSHQAVCKKAGRKIRTVYLTPQGKTLNQAMAHELAKEEELILLCGHYEGVDQRALDLIVTDEISIGDYVLTGGELPALVLIDSVSRLVPGVLHNDESASFESFENGLLEYPQYSRPEEFCGLSVPPVLLSGDHKKVEEWRFERSYEKTALKRPDIITEEQREAYTRMIEKRRKKEERKRRKAEKALANNQ